MLTKYSLGRYDYLGQELWNYFKLFQFNSFVFIPVL